MGKITIEYIFEDGFQKDLDEAIQSMKLAIDYKEKYIKLGKIDFYPTICPHCNKAITNK